ncbi:MAG: collagen-like protein [Desulfobacteraceae bacterium]|nr:collagen-like protein [Desulfobacteraceae bacterium]
MSGSVIADSEDGEQNRTIITGVYVDHYSDVILISGLNLNKRVLSKLNVFLGELGELSVLDYFEGELTVAFPDSGIPSGDYLLTLAMPGKSDDDEDDESGELSRRQEQKSYNVLASYPLTIGMVGPQGLDGPPGPIGLTGAQGPDGPQGPAGTPGPKGDTGPAGPQGLVGPKGSRGDRGLPGPVGQTGPAGEQGPIGPQGIQGVEGPAGTPGETGTCACPIDENQWIALQEEINLLKEQAAFSGAAPLVEVINNSGRDINHVMVGNIIFSENMDAPNCGQGCTTGYKPVAEGFNQITLQTPEGQGVIKLHPASNFYMSLAYTLELVESNFSTPCGNLWSRSNRGLSFADDPGKKVIGTMCIPESLITFEKILDYGVSYHPNSVQEVSGGGYVLTGSYGNTALTRTDENGNTLWTQGGQFDGGLSSYSASVQETDDGGFITAGSYGDWDYYIQAYLFKTNRDGVLLWTKTYGERPEQYSANSVQQTGDGGYIIAGVCGPRSGYESDRMGYLLKTDGLGNKEWDKILGAPDNFEARCVRQTRDGGYIIAGSITHGPPLAKKRDVLLMKTDASGNPLWTKYHGSDASNDGHSVLQTVDGGYIIAGMGVNINGHMDAYLLKTDGQGNATWERLLGSPRTEVGHAVSQTPDGDGYIIVGYTYPFHAIRTDIYMAETDLNGNIVWEKTYGDPDTDEMAFSVQATRDGGYVISGIINGPGIGTKPFFIKTDQTGDVH